MITALVTNQFADYQQSQTFSAERIEFESDVLFGIFGRFAESVIVATCSTKATSVRIGRTLRSFEFVADSYPKTTRDYQVLQTLVGEK